MYRASGKPDERLDSSESQQTVVDTPKQSKPLLDGSSLGAPQNPGQRLGNQARAGRPKSRRDSPPPAHTAGVVVGSDLRGASNSWKQPKKGFEVYVASQK